MYDFRSFRDGAGQNGSCAGGGGSYPPRSGPAPTVTETADGFLIVPQAIIAANDIENMRRILEEEGFSLDELIESGREIRGELLHEKYGIAPDSSS